MTRGSSELDQVEVARMLGIGAVKYADLSTERVRDYLFDFDRMLAFEGNTAPYLQYAHARIRSIFRRGGFSSPELGTKILVDDPHERELALALLSFPDHLGVHARRPRPEPALRLPVLARHRVHRLLRELPDPSRRGGGAGEPAGAL